MLTNYGFIKIPIFSKDTVSMYSKNSFDSSFFKEQGYCIFNGHYESIKSIEKSDIYKGFEVISQNNLGIKYMPVTPVDGESAYIHNRKEQPLHVDNAHSNSIPDFISLVCLENASYGGETYLKKIDDSFDCAELAPLFDEPVTYIKHGVCHEVFILERENTNIITRYSPFCDFYEFKNYSQYIAMIYFHNKIYRSPTLSYKLKPGEAIILDNYKYMHGRSVFSGQRDIIRVWLNKND